MGSIIPHPRVAVGERMRDIECFGVDHAWVPPPHCHPYWELLETPGRESRK